MTNGITSEINGDNLLSCPFCGKEAALVEDEPTKGFCVVECTGCASHGPMSNRETAVSLWNRRAAVTDHDFAMAVHDGRAWVCAEGMSPEEIEAVRGGRFMAVTPHRFADACALLDERHEEIQRQQERIAELTVERDAYFDMVKRVQADCDARDVLIRDMARELRGLNDSGVPTDCMEHESRMRDMGIEVDAHAGRLRGEGETDDD